MKLKESQKWMESCFRQKSSFFISFPNAYQCVHTSEANTQPHIRCDRVPLKRPVFISGYSATRIRLLFLESPDRWNGISWWLWRRPSWLRLMFFQSLITEFAISSTRVVVGGPYLPVALSPGGFGVCRMHCTHAKRLTVRHWSETRLNLWW